MSLHVHPQPMRILYLARANHALIHANSVTTLHIARNAKHLISSISINAIVHVLLPITHLQQINVSLAPAYAKYAHLPQIVRNVNHLIMFKQEYAPLTVV